VACRQQLIVQLHAQHAQAQLPLPRGGQQRTLHSVDRQVEQLVPTVRLGIQQQPRQVHLHRHQGVVRVGFDDPHAQQHLQRLLLLRRQEGRGRVELAGGRTL
jgi:hypothetical protein